MSSPKRLLSLLAALLLVIACGACTRNSTDSIAEATVDTPGIAPPMVIPTSSSKPTSLPRPTLAIPSEPPTSWPVLRQTAVFEQARTELAESTQIPPRLPSVWWFWDATDDPDLQTTTAWTEFGYRVYLSTVWCPGSTVCTFASFSAATPDHEYGLGIGGDETLGVPVPLPNGRSGLFRDATCGVSCGHGWVLWSEGTIDYAVGTKVGDLSEVLPLAWSAIDPTAIYPFERPESCSDGAVPSPDGQGKAELVQDQAITWLVLCPDGGTPQVVVVHPADTLQWRNVTAQRWTSHADKAELLVSDGGTTWIFQGTSPMFDTGPWGRLAIADMRCGDVHLGGTQDLVDGTTSEVIVFTGPNRAERETVDRATADALPVC